MNAKLMISIGLLFLATCLTANAQRNHIGRHKSKPGNGEIIYHIFQRSFYDSNGDLHGDLNGIRQKLDYLQDLGVTAILLTPLYESVYYHNYFASDFKKIDPKYGTMADYLTLIKELHKRGMKFYMDMETQYVTEDHMWWKESYNKPKSKYSDYILYDDKENKKPATIVSNLEGLKGYDDVYRRIATVNLNNEKVKEYNYQLFKFWMDPNKDGKFDDGVDGFRLDHMMDKLDNKPRLSHLFANFWNPLFSKLKHINPKLKVIAEQAQWGSLGIEYLKKGGVDGVFAFRIMGAIKSFNKVQLTSAADSTFLFTPSNKQQVVFIENHDLPRFSYGVKGDLPRLKVGGALNLLIGGMPSIYYGQELGMNGTSAKYGMTDANEIPDRGAFEWYKSDEGKGMAYWYKNSKVGRKRNYDVPNDGISLEEEKYDSNSLFNFYKKIISIRKSNLALTHGAYKTLVNNNDKVFSFLRYEKHKGVIVAVNLSNKTQEVEIATDKVSGVKKNIIVLFGKESPAIGLKTFSVKLPAYGIEVWDISTRSKLTKY